MRAIGRRLRCIKVVLQSLGKRGTQAMWQARQLWMALVALCVPLAAAHAEDGGPSLDRLTGFEFGARYWYSTGRIGYNYYGDTTDSLLVSRLTYDKLTANS